MEKNQLTQVFSYFDKDGSGYICMTELEEIMKALGHKDITKEELNEIMKKEDLNGDRKLDLDEFCNLFGRYQQESKKIVRELNSAFMRFDRDNSGFIDQKELMKVLTASGPFALSRKEAQYFIRQFDTNHDGQLDYKEFVNLLSGLFPSFEELEKFNKDTA